MHPDLNRTPAGFWQKFGELILLLMIPIGLLQLSDSISMLEYSLVTRTAVLLATLGGILVLSAVIAGWWERKGGGERLHTIFVTIAVLYLAYSISTYGAAKILGTQFQTPHSVLDTPLGELSGFWLTWAYHGYSPTMALILGWTQIVGCALLLFRVSRILGIFILLPVMVNIDLVDHFYHISPLAYYNSLHYTFFLLVLLLFDLPLIQTIFLAYRNKTRLVPPRMLLNGLRLAVILIAFIHIAMLKGGFTPRTRLNGVWQVDSLVRSQQAIKAVGEGPTWSKLYFEWRYGCIFKVDPHQFTDKDLEGDYTVDQTSKTMHIGFQQETDNPATKPKVDSMVLNYQFKTDTLLEMRGEYKNEALVFYLKRLK